MLSTSRVDLKIRKAILKAVFGRVAKTECLVFLFGSYATGDEIGLSDIDVGLLCKGVLPAKDFLAIEEDIQNTSPTLRKIDLVDFNHVSKQVKKEALKKIQIWHAGKNCSELLKTLKKRQEK